MDLWLVNLVCGSVFIFGLFKLARLQPNPSLAVLVAIPYLIIVVGMGYTRQSMALGIVMVGLAGLMSGSTAVRYVSNVIVATLFHKSAIVMTAVLAAGHRTRFINLVVGLSVGYALYDLIVSSSVSTLSRNYLEAGYDAQGATVRVLMNFVPAVLFLLRPHQFGFDERQLGIVRIMSFAGLLFPLLLFVVPSSAAVDRMALYMSLSPDHDPVATSRGLSKRRLRKGRHHRLRVCGPIRLAELRAARRRLGPRQTMALRVVNGNNQKTSSRHWERPVLP